ncbi:hypothetical protein GCM10023201_03220 [Actinomycetospora corticicola]|uniref:Putative alkaline shock family protein YloU n=1 Tax=Actinomycetospora corticicola TaxID=663602 RepID=A0A7Y9E237_9PSEU|nr:Asp23/Gls24 family envelope stress response protein [Actinomycetospora corticicola]NYD39844.1 putative alkaline shock family protein YloU [Actinomycetospora corticicola]
MTVPTTATTPDPAGSALSTSPAGAGSALDTPEGKTTISDSVVSKVAGIAAREIPGVYGFGGGAARAFGAISERISGGRSSSTQGVSVEVGERQAAIDLTVVVEYGVGIAELARAIRRNVIGAVEQMTGLDVVEVNINVVDLHLPSDDNDDDRDETTSRPANRVQ